MKELKFKLYDDRPKEDVTKIFDPSEYANELVFDKVDDAVTNEVMDAESDLPIPANFVEACLGRKFLSTTVLPRQIQIASEYFGEICHFCSNPDATENLFDQKMDYIYDNIVFLRHGMCPKCKRTKIDMIKAGKWNFKNALFVVAGQRSGKSIATSLIAHYQNMRFLTMRNKKGKRVIPYQYFKNPPAPLYGTFTAVTYDQAIKNLWEPFKGYIESPWYKDYHEILNYFSKKSGVELYKSSQTFLQYSHKRIAWLPETPSKKGLRGKTRIFFSIDELSWYDLNNKDDSVKGSAKEIMAAGRNSLLTVRRKSLEKLSKGNYNIPTGMECYVSSPAEANDILMRKVRESRRDPTMLGYRYATWEFNPDYHTPEDIGEPDHLILMRDFGANPPLGNAQFYSDAKTLVENIDQNRKPMATFVKQESKNSFGDTTYYPKLDSVLYSSTYPKILTIDNGLSGNCFAASMNHLEGKKVCNDFLVCIQPDERHKINLSKCFEEFVYSLLKDKRFNIAMVAYDRWNSEQAIAQLRDEGYNAVKYSITYNDFLQIRDSFAMKAFGFVKPITNTEKLIDYEGDFDFVDASYRDQYFGLLYQILTVRDMGKFLAKPTVGDDDVFRAWALGATLLMDEDYKSIFTGEGKIKQQSNRALGSMSSFSHRVSTSQASSSNVFGKLQPHKF